MKNDSKQKIKLGVFVISGMLLFIVGVYLIGEKQSLFNDNIVISANFNNINGLQRGNNVRYSGIKVGIVKEIKMLNDSTIKVDLLIDEEMQLFIKKDAVATIGTDGLVGSMLVNIIPGEKSEAVVRSGDFIKTYTKIGADEMLSTLNVTNENAALLTADLLKITNAINSNKGTIGMLINDSVASKNFQQIIINLKQSSVDASKTLNRLNKIVTSINFDTSVAGAILNDSVQGNKVKNIIDDLEVTSRTIRKTTDSLNLYFNTIKNGKGAINYLSTDKEFVENLEQTIKNLNKGTAKFDENMEALKHNFLFKGYFKKLEKEKK
jgi:phospholipid/cholesterol/gamma-HCH transport system substrate-binding protein